MAFSELRLRHELPCPVVFILTYFILSYFIILLMCISVLLARVSGHCWHSWYLERPEEGIGSPKTEITDLSHHVGAEN